MKNKNKFLKIILLSIIFSMLSTTFIYASSNLDLSSGKVIGSDSKYYFEIPNSWQNNIYVKRDYTEGNDYFDKLDFYYKHKDIGNKDMRYLNLYAYDIGSYRGYKNQDIILVTDKYVFTVTKYLVNPYSSTNDRIAFSGFVKELGTSNFISDRIFVPTDKNPMQSGTLSVNGKMTLKMPIIEKGEVYLPLRESAEKLGYSVSWIANTKMVLLTRADNSVTISTNSVKKKNIDGSMYLPIKFFMKTLGCNVDIDSKNNITLTD